LLSAAVHITRDLARARELAEPQPPLAEEAEPPPVGDPSLAS
jgi:hypothetical protein